MNRYLKLFVSSSLIAVLYMSSASAASMTAEQADALMGNFGGTDTPPPVDSPPNTPRANPNSPPDSPVAPRPNPRIRNKGGK